MWQLRLDWNILIQVNNEQGSLRSDESIRLVDPDCLDYVSCNNIGKYISQGEQTLEAGCTVLPTMSNFHIGKRLSYDGHRCTVRYVGQVKGTAGDWLGVEWDDPSRGRNSGQAKDMKYFDCVFPNAGSFVRPSRSADATRSFLQALRHKYIGGDAALQDQYTNIRISGKEVEAVGFDKIQKRQAALGNLTRVYLDSTCLNQAFDEDFGESLADIYATCPKITELDLGESLIETFDEIASICSQLTGLTTLWLNGNRFRGLSHQLRSDTFSKIFNLTLESCFLTWAECVEVSSHFTDLTDLSLLRNNLAGTNFSNDHSLPPSITHLNLGFNDFRCLGPGLDMVARLPSLRKLLLHQCKLNAIHTPIPFFSSTLAEVDLSYNDIDSWSFVDQLPCIFPGMTHLLISHNPIFQAPASQKDTTTDLLITARLSNLTRLNNSAISRKYREEAELYYISIVAREIETQKDSSELDIINRNPRYLELCALYETPVFKRSQHRINPNSLSARLINIKFIIERSDVTQNPKEISEDVPKEMSLYGLIGHVGRISNPSFVSPLDIVLYKEEETIETMDLNTTADGFWDSDEDDEDMGRRVTRRVEITPSPRTVGVTFDGDEVKCFIKIHPNKVEGK